MRLRPVKLLVCLLLGAAISILVAWRCTIVGDRDTTFQNLPTAETESLWHEIVGPISPDHVLHGNSGSAAGNTWILLDQEPRIAPDIDAMPNDHSFISVVRRQTGWPLRCVECDRIVRGNPLAFSKKHEFRGWLSTPPISLLTNRSQHGLPIRPLWTGLILNTIFYGMITWLVWSAVSRLRRRARLDRTRCPKCRYDLRAAEAKDGIITCPECGTRIAALFFGRPQQILRWWMLPLLLPAFVFGAIWFCGGFDWLWLRFHLRWSEPILTFSALLILPFAAVWLYLIGVFAYNDRSIRARHRIAALIAILLAIAAYVPLYALAVWWTQ